MHRGHRHTEDRMVGAECDGYVEVVTGSEHHIVAVVQVIHSRAHSLHDRDRHRLRQAVALCATPLPAVETVLEEVEDCEDPHATSASVAATEPQRPQTLAPVPLVAPSIRESPFASRLPQAARAITERPRCRGGTGETLRSWGTVSAAKTDRDGSTPQPAVSAVRGANAKSEATSPGAIRMIAFVVGSASLGAEISAARLLAPYFGASTIIWANTIATVLVALSAGYAIGGRLADRRANLRGLCTIVLVAAVLLALVPFVADPFLRLAVSALGALSVGGFLGSLAAVLVLVAVPVMLLGTVAPYANRLALGRVDDAGTVTGSLYAISTAGSLVGTFMAALLLIPLIGTHRTFLVFALMLAVVAAPRVGSRGFLLVPVAIAALLAVPPAAVGSSVAGAKVIYETETPYQYARVLQFRSGERWLQLNEGEAIHSEYRPWSYLTGGYWDDFLTLPLAGGLGVPKRIAILGDAAGTVARAYGHYFPQTRVDAVELDGELTAIGKRYFGLGGPRLHLYTADARPWLFASRARYDAIFLDAYRQPYIPFYLLTREFFQSIRQHLQPGGLLIVNVGHLPASDSLEKVVSATARAVFTTVMRDPVSDTNSLVIASSGTLSGSRILAVAGLLPVELRSPAQAVGARLSSALPGGAVYTDDRAPVEWLTDLSILSYAIGNRQGPSGGGR
jgi:spermidine synthase